MQPAGYACFDASDPAAVSAAVELLPARVDVLVNNAGGNTDFDREPVRDGDLAGLVAETRTGRAGTTADVAATVMFLASPAAGHLTGQVIHVNGGAYLGR